MSIKKLLILTAAGLAAVTSAAAFAGGPDQMEQSWFAPAIYVDAHGGYSFYNWDPIIAGNTGVIWYNQAGTTTNNQGGAIGGADVGFQIFKHIAVEVGGFYLPRVKGVANSALDVSAPTCQGANTSSSNCTVGEQYNWVAYGAGRFDVPMPYVEGLQMFAKLGAAWRAMSNQNFVVPGQAGMHSYWTVIFGAGFDYDIMNTGFRVGVQWLHIPGHTQGTNGRSAPGENDASNHSALATTQPAQDLLTGSVGYKFDF